MLSWFYQSYSKIASALLFLGFSLMLVTDKVGGYCFAVLLFISVIQLINGKNRFFDRTDYWVIMVFSTYPLVVLLNLLAQTELKLDAFDNASRFILVIPIYLALRGQTSALKAVSLGGLLGLLAAIVMAVGAMSNKTGMRFGGYENPVAFAQAAVFLACAGSCIWVKTPEETAFHSWCIAPLTLIATAVTSLASQTRTTIFSALLLLPFVFSKKLALNKRLLLIGSSLALFAFISAAIVKVFSAPHVIEFSEKNTNIIAMASDFEAHEIVELLLNEKSTAMVSMGRRGALWIAGSEAILSKPILGIGKGNFQSFALESSSLSPDMKQSISIYSQAHNDLIQVTAELGVVGLLSYLIFVAGCISITFQKDMNPKSRRLVTMTVMSFFYYGLAQSALVGSQNLTLTVAMLAAVGLAAGRTSTSDSHN